MTGTHSRYRIRRKREDVEAQIDDLRLIGLVNEARTDAERRAIGREARARLRFIRRSA